jgi:hypothetical protein
VSLACEKFFANRRLDDGLLLHLSCHGLKDDDGRLYFAARNTDHAYPRSTSLPASTLLDFMERCQARSIVVLLDCCYSGAFMAGSKGNDPGVHLQENLAPRRDLFPEGRGRAVLTASNAIEYAWEGEKLSGKPKPSLFTAAVVRGLESGEADIDGDGWISVDDLFTYVSSEVQRLKPGQQTPMKWQFGVRESLYIARGRAAVAPSRSERLKPKMKVLNPPQTRWPRTAKLPDEARLYCQMIAGEIAAGRVVPIVGAGANLVGRPEEFTWESDETIHPPVTYELMKALATSFHSYRGNLSTLEPLDAVSLMVGNMPAYEKLHEFLDRDYRPTQVHSFLAEIPSFRSNRYKDSGYPLILTTNYDDVLERAFDQAQQPYELICYDNNADQFLHDPHSPNRTPLPITDPESYNGITMNTSVIVKLAGSVNRTSPLRSESFLISSSDYMDYRGTDLFRLLPVGIAETLMRRHLLLLSDGFRDWFVDTFLSIRKKSAGGRLHARDWSVQLEPDAYDKVQSNRHEILIIRASLESFVDCLRVRLQEISQPQA